MQIRQLQTPIVEPVARNRFVWLLVALLVFFLFVPVLRELSDGIHPRILQFLEVGFFLGVVASVIVSIGRKRRLRGVTLALSFSIALLWVLPASVVNDSVRVLRHLLAIAFFAYAIVSILRLIFASRTVTIDLLCASLCAYLLLGVLCALIYSTMSILNPKDFFSSVAEESSAAAMQLDLGGPANALYFSFVTLTTLGYGDIVPASPLARRLAVVEAIVGQLYLAVLVARLVGLYTAEDSRTHTAAP